MQVKINISPAPSLQEPLDTVAQSLCEANDGPASTRLINGLFCLPYEPVTDELQPNKQYYFDNVLVEDGKQVPQIYVWRRWGYRADDLLINLSNRGYQLSERKVIENETV